MRSLAALVLATALLAGCGGAPRSAGDVDREDPKAVAKAIFEARYRCGEQGAGLIYDLITHPPRGETREAALAEERQDGCEPRPIPEVEIFELSRGPDAAVVEVRVTDDPEERGGQLRMLRTESGWKGDTAPGEAP